MIKRLIVQNLRGYSQPTLDIEFNSDLNLITGRNGAGKTTLLKLVWYLISGNIHLAKAETPFLFATIQTDDYSMTIDLTDPASPKVNVDQSGKEAEFKNLTIEELDEEDFVEIESNVLERAGTFTEDFGRSLFFPTFRRVEGGYSIPRDNRSLFRTASGRTAQRTRNTLEEGLDEISTRLSNEQHYFICSVSTNDIVQLVLNKFNAVTERYSTAQQALSSSIIEEIRHFEQSEDELAINSAKEVISRIKKAIQGVDVQRTEMMSSLDAVQKLVIELFDHRGIAFGARYSFGEKAEAVLSEHLSAGEKQMLSFICYNAFYDNTVIIIDEPELSLHIDWQRELFPILESQETTNQFIVATHSPFIYSKYPEKEVRLNRDRGE